MRRLLWEIYALFYDSILLLWPYRLMLEKISGMIDCSQKRIIDLGCGTGNLAREIYKKNELPQYFIGIDNSIVMLFFAKLKNFFNHSSKFIFDNLNKNISIENSSCDVIFCINMLYITECPRDFLENIYKKLCFGGDLILVNPRHNPSISDVIKEHFEILKKKELKDKISFYCSCLWFFLPFVFVLFFNLLVVKFLGKNKIYNFYSE